METFGERLKLLRKQLGKTQQEFSDSLGITRSTIATYEAGNSSPSDSALSLICKTWNVRREWLLDGIGEMFEPSSPAFIDSLVNENDLTETDKIFLRDFAMLPENQRKAVITFTLKVAEDIKKQSEHYTESDYEKDLGITDSTKLSGSNTSGESGTETA